MEREEGNNHTSSAAAAGCLRHGVVDSCPGLREADDDVQSEMMTCVLSNCAAIAAQFGILNEQKEKRV